MLPNKLARHKPQLVKDLPIPNVSVPSSSDPLVLSLRTEEQSVGPDQEGTVEQSKEKRKKKPHVWCRGWSSAGSALAQHAWSSGLDSRSHVDKV